MVRKVFGAALMLGALCSAEVVVVHLWADVGIPWLDRVPNSEAPKNESKGPVAAPENGGAATPKEGVKPVPNEQHGGWGPFSNERMNQVIAIFAPNAISVTASKTYRFSNTVTVAEIESALESVDASPQIIEQSAPLILKYLKDPRFKGVTIAVSAAAGTVALLRFTTVRNDVVLFVAAAIFVTTFGLHRILIKRGVLGGRGERGGYED